MFSLFLSPNPGVLQNWPGECSSKIFTSFFFFFNSKASLVAQTVKSLPAMKQTQVRSLGWEVPLEKEMATHSSILAWRIPWTKESGATVHGVRKSQTQLSN